MGHGVGDGTALNCRYSSLSSPFQRPSLRTPYFTTGKHFRAANIERSCSLLKRDSSICLNTAVTRLLRERISVWASQSKALLNYLTAATY